MMWLIWILAVIATNNTEWFGNVGALTKTIFYPHVYFGCKNLRYDSDKLCYVSALKEVLITGCAVWVSQITTHSFIITVNQ